MGRMSDIPGTEHAALLDNGAMINSWVPLTKPDAAARLRLFCFPFAGGSASFFTAWKPFMPDGVELCAIQLPGRERRIRETPIASMVELVKSLSRSLEPLLSATPFVFYGHSMGALVAYALAQHLAHNRGPNPLHIFLSAMYAPARMPADRIVNDLPDEDLMAELRRLNNTSRDVLEAENLLRLMLPTIRADFKLIETYDFRGLTLLTCPLSVFGGTEDRICRSDLMYWRETTASTFRLRMLPGDHFFVRNAHDHLLPRMSRELELLKLQVARLGESPGLF